MRPAPAVSVCCSGGRPWLLAVALLHVVATAAVAVWLLQHLELHPAWAAIPTLLLTGLTYSLAGRQAVRLVFDGQGWTADGRPGRPELMIDLGRLLLLRWWPEDASQASWLPCSAAEAGPAWHAFRVAVHAQRGPATASGALLPPARD
jgi:hypothetical protein